MNDSIDTAIVRATNWKMHINELHKATAESNKFSKTVGESRLLKPVLVQLLLQPKYVGTISRK